MPINRWVFKYPLSQSLFWTFTNEKNVSEEYINKYKEQGRSARIWQGNDYIQIIISSRNWYYSNYGQQC